MHSINKLYVLRWVITLEEFWEYERILQGIELLHYVVTKVDSKEFWQCCIAGQFQKHSKSEWLVQCMLNTLEIPSLHTEFIKIVPTEILHFQCTSLWYQSTNWMADLNLNIPVNTKEFFRLAEFRVTIHTIYIGLSDCCIFCSELSVYRYLQCSCPLAVSELIEVWMANVLKGLLQRWMTLCIWWLGAFRITSQVGLSSLCITLLHWIMWVFCCEISLFPLFVFCRYVVSTSRRPEVTDFRDALLVFSASLLNLGGGFWYDSEYLLLEQSPHLHNFVIFILMYSATKLHLNKSRSSYSTTLTLNT
jgi:hypothetical protein